jgi:hypothetical protein
MPAYKNFLSDIGYLLPEGAPFKVGTSRVDPGLAAMSGPQLVCPMAFKNGALGGKLTAGRGGTKIYVEWRQALKDDLSPHPCTADLLAFLQHEGAMPRR